MLNNDLHFIDYLKYSSHTHCQTVHYLCISCCDKSECLLWKKKSLLMFLNEFIAPEERRRKEDGWQAKGINTSCFLYVVSR